jgi:hypothetical protein
VPVIKKILFGISLFFYQATQKKYLPIAVPFLLAAFIFGGIAPIKRLAMKS